MAETLLPVARRLAATLAVLSVAGVLTWALLLLSPVDPARQVLLAQGNASPTPVEIEQARTRLGLDDPYVVQCSRWLADALTGDLGQSWQTGAPVVTEIGQRLPATLRLTCMALLIGGAFALALTVFGLYRSGGAADLASRGLIFGAAATPVFVLAILLLEVVVVGWGLGSVVADGSWSGAILPAVPLGLGIGAEWARVLRTGLRDALAAPHSQIATARGAGKPRIMLVHGFPHAAKPFLAVAGMTAGGLLAGAAIVETLFTWPGVGRRLVSAINAGDLPVIQAIVLLAVTAFLVLNTFTDLLATAIDPRDRPVGRRIR